MNDLPPFGPEPERLLHRLRWEAEPRARTTELGVVVQSHPIEMAENDESLVIEVARPSLTNMT